MEPVSAALAAGSLGLGAYSAFGRKSGPDYSAVYDRFNARQLQISQFAAGLAQARARYLTSLGNMYNDAFARFSGNAEAGFANRGLAVSGGAFASALARETGRYQAELTPLAYQAEREDLASVDNAYGANSGAFMNALMGQANLGYQGQRAAEAGFANTLGQVGALYQSSRLSDRLNTDRYGNPSGSRYETDYSIPMRSNDRLGLGR